MTTEKRCVGCVYYGYEKMVEDWEQPQYNWTKHLCAIRPQNENLLNFPFKHTNCPKYEPIK